MYYSALGFHIGLENKSPEIRFICHLPNLSYVQQLNVQHHSDKNHKEQCTVYQQVWKTGATQYIVKNENAKQRQTSLIIVILGTLAVILSVLGQPSECDQTTTDTAATGFPLESPSMWFLFIQNPETSAYCIWHMCHQAR